MFCLVIAFPAAATAVVRRNQFEVEVTATQVDSFAPSVESATRGIDEFGSPSSAQDSKLEQELPRWSTHCGSGEHAEYECVLDCMNDSKCRNQPEVIAAIKAATVFKAEQIQDGFGFATGAPCASFYGDNAFEAMVSFGKSFTASASFCATGEHDAAECIDGICVSYNNDEECTGNSWRDHKKCKIRAKSCGNADECFRKCMGDEDCRKQLMRQGAANGVLNDALKVRCLQEQDGKKKCFFTPTNPCSDTCQDGYDCHDGRCKAVNSVAPQWLEPAKNLPPPPRAPAQHKCKHWWQKCEGEWKTPSDPDAHDGCGKCWRKSNCCIRA